MPLLFAASHQLFQRNSGFLWDKERHWGQLQTDETVSSGGGRLQAWTSAGCSLHRLVSSNPNVKLAEAMINAALTPIICRSLCRILEITQSLTSVVLSLPEELTEDLHQAVTFVSQFLSWLTSASESMNPDVRCTRFLQQSPASKWTDVVMTEKRCYTIWFSWSVVGLDSLLHLQIM